MFKAKEHTEKEENHYFRDRERVLESAGVARKVYVESGLRPLTMKEEKKQRTYSTVEKVG